MDFWKSEEMGLYSFVIHQDSSWEIITKIGNMEFAQFIDLNKNLPIFEKKFANYIRKCEEVELNLKYIEDEADKLEIFYNNDLNLNLNYKKRPKDESDDFNTWLDELMINRKKDHSSLLDDIQNEITEFKDFFSVQVDKLMSMNDSLLKCIEKREAISKAIIIISNLNPNAILNQNKGFPLNIADNNGNNIKNKNIGFNFAYYLGIMNKADCFRFKMLLFRSTRGNVLVYFKDLETSLKTFAGKNIQRCLYVIVYKESEHLKDRIKKVCEAISSDTIQFFLSNDHNISEDQALLTQSIQEIKQLILTSKSIIEEKIKKFILTNQNNNLKSNLLTYYKIFIKRQKYIFTIMNMMKAENYLYRGLYWAPKSQEQAVLEYFNEFEQSKNFIIPKINQIYKHNLTPPTLIRSNTFLFPFQEIVYSYGIPSYDEINPAIISTITFPFFIGLMYGDLFHGLYLFAFSIFLSFIPKWKGKFPQELKQLVPFRHLLLIISIFSMFGGLIYNEFGSVPISLFDSCYTNSNLETIRKKDCFYPIGIDTKWQIANNQLIFVNSIKMKFAIIIGIIHMIIGLLLKGLNNLKNSINFYFEFLPQLLLMLLIFGYLILLIVIKWLSNWSLETHLAPSITGFFCDFLTRYGYTDEAPFFGQGNNQIIISKIILSLVIILIPIMIIVKPVLLRYKHKKDSFQNHALFGQDIPLVHLKQNQLFNADEIEDNINFREDSSEDFFANYIRKPQEQFKFGQVFLFQALEAIEFLMSSISNTSSYLRLWALSLAHSELSRIFFGFTLQYAIKSDNPNFFLIFFANFFLQLITFGIIICINLLECFLHSVRLHWIEFQNKFYKAQGTKFEPFNLNQII